MATKSSFSFQKKEPKRYVQEYNHNVNPTWHTTFLQSVNNSINMHKRLFMLHIDLKLWLLIRYSSLGQTLCTTTCTTVFYTDSLINWNWPLMQSKFKINHGSNLKWREGHLLVGRQFGVAVEHVTAPCPHCFVRKTCETYTDCSIKTGSDCAASQSQSTTY